MSEKPLENFLTRTLTNAHGDVARLNELLLTNTDSQVTTIGDLIGANPFQVIQDSSDWNPNPKLMYDVANGITPDLVIRSGLTGENRIVIEVKVDAQLGYEVGSCQATRYFLHLLATTHQSKERQNNEIRRAMILAAPNSWFSVQRNAEKWDAFLGTCRKLASSFGIVLGELRFEEEFVKSLNV